MRVINERPPMWGEIDATFHIGNRPVIFTWGDTIYNPNGGTITRELHAHEEIHWKRQGDAEDGIRAWWNRYLIEPAFRLDEELPAHKAEYQAFCKRHADRNARAKYLTMVSGRLAGPLYGNIIDANAVRKRILTA